ncbi:MAG: metal-sensing transcriptional repressor, partial [Treponema sp.]|nr:metal-sensing transcriptional repressor [Treponema sp.]
YCADILIQASACTAAVNSFSKVLISSHLKSCVQNDIKNGNEESLDEFLKIMSKLLK